MSQFLDSMRMQLRARRDRIVAAAPGGIQRACNQILVPYLRQYGPGLNRKVHIYSKGRTQPLYGVKRTARGAQIYNTRSNKGRDVSEYIDLGYTRRGERSARSFRQRRIRTSYTSRAFYARKAALEKALAAYLNAEVR